MSRDDRTDRFRPVFEPEDIFDRFVRNANASTEEVLPRDDEPTGQVKNQRPSRRKPAPEEKKPEAQTAQTAQERPRRGGPPTWDHAITVKGPPPADDGTEDPEAAEAPEDGTRPDAPMPLAMARAFGDEDLPDVEVDEDDLTRPRASPLTDSGQRILLLTRVKRPGSQPPPSSEVDEDDTVRGEAVGGDTPTPHVGEAADDRTEDRIWDSVVSPRGLHTQRLEAMKVVPDVEAAATKREDTYVGEGVEDGLMPTRQLDQILSDMAVLLRYGHAGQVRDRLEQLRRTYPEDLLLLRRIAEFHVEHEQYDAALETLFALAGGLFERRNVEGMRQALEQVLVLDPGNSRAIRLLGLLEQRPQDASGE